MGKTDNKFKKCSELNILDISGNILAASTPMLARIPPFTTGLQELYAKQCQIESGFDIFADILLSSCKRIRILDFSENNVEQNAVQLFTSLGSSLEELKLRNCNIPEAAMCSIKTLIDKVNGNLELLDLFGNVCDPEILIELTMVSNRFGTRVEFPQCSTNDTESVLNLLQGNPKWETNKTISFESVNFSQKGLSAVTGVIQHSPCLENLNIAYCKVMNHNKTDNVCNEALQRLIESVGAKNLETLNFSGHKLTSNTCCCLFLDLLKKSQQLISLHTVDCGFSETAKLDDILTELEQGHKELCSIDMSENYVGGEGTPKFTKLVLSKPSLKNIHLRECHMSDNEATKSLLLAVQETCNSIQSIDLRENKCCAEVIAMLTKMKLKSPGYPRCEPKESEKLISLLEAGDTDWEDLETVDLSETVITEPHGVNAVCCMIESLPNLYHFSIMKCKVNNGDCQQKLIRSLSKNGKLLQRLNLGDNSLEEKSINRLQGAVSSFSNLQSLNLSSCKNHCDKGLRSLTNELNKSETLTELDLSDNICESETIANLAIYCHKKCVKANYPICVTDGEAVVKYQRDHSDWENIHRLDLTEQAVSRSALIGLASITPYMIELQELLFSKCKTGDNLELANLIRSLEDKASKIKHIDFSFVPLTGEPIEATAKLMCKESSLETLNLENCKLVKETQFEFFTKQMADSCSNLKTLNMSNNPLGDDGFAAMAGTLKNLQNIEKLLLEKTELKSCSEVISAIRENCKKIHTLSLKGNLASMVDIFLPDKDDCRPENGKKKPQIP